MAWLSSEMLQRTSPASTRAASILTDAIDAIFNWHEVCRARRQLSALDDWMLRDIGITRADVEREYRKRFWQI